MIPSTASRTIDSILDDAASGRRILPEDAILLAEKASLADLGGESVAIDDDIAKLSVVGIGMRSHAGVAAAMFDALAKVGINIQMISTSEIKISCVIGREKAEDAVRVLHKEFKLGEGA